MSEQVDGAAVEAATMAYLANLGIEWADVNPHGHLPYSILEWLFTLRIGETSTAPKDAVPHV